MQSPFLFIGALSAAISIGLGAFGAHGLKDTLTPEMLSVYQTGVTYQLWHSLGLVLIAALQQHDAKSNALVWAGGLMCGGIVFFSGSLYALALLNQSWWGLFTPVGGVSFIAAWLAVASAALGERTGGRYRSGSKKTKNRGRYAQPANDDSA